MNVQNFCPSLHYTSGTHVPSVITSNPYLQTKDYQQTEVILFPSLLVKNDGLVKVVSKGQHFWKSQEPLGM